MGLRVHGTRRARALECTERQPSCCFPSSRDDPKSSGVWKHRTQQPHDSTVLRCPPHGHTCHDVPGHLNIPPTLTEAQTPQCTGHPAGLDDRSKLFRTKEDVGHFACGGGRFQNCVFGLLHFSICALSLWVCLLPDSASGTAYHIPGANAQVHFKGIWRHMRRLFWGVSKRVASYLHMKSTVSFTSSAWEILYSIKV